VQPQLGDALEVAPVPRHQGEVVSQGRCRDQEIAVGDKLALPSKHRAMAGEAFHDRVREVDDRIAIENCRIVRRLSCGSGPSQAPSWSSPTEMMLTPTPSRLRLAKAVSVVGIPVNPSISQSVSTRYLMGGPAGASLPHGRDRCKP
jgi:hypothetical protein